MAVNDLTNFPPVRLDPPSPAQGETDRRSQALCGEWSAKADRTKERHHDVDASRCAVRGSPPSAVDAERAFNREAQVKRAVDCVSAYHTPTTVIFTPRPSGLVIF